MGERKEEEGNDFRRKVMAGGGRKVTIGGNFV